MINTCCTKLNKVSVWAKMKNENNIIKEYSFDMHNIMKLKLCDYEKTRYIISDVYPDATDIVLNSSYIRDYQFIVCPIYKNTNERPFSIFNPFPVCHGYRKFDYFDIQIGVTGSMKKNELPFDTMLRETSEEIGFSGYPDKIFKPIFETHKKWYPYSCKLNNKPVYSKYNNKNDVRNSKISCIVYGSKSDAFTFISLLDVKKVDISSSDGIVGVGIINVGDARKFKSNR
jgi:hypothetical protein